MRQIKRKYRRTGLLDTLFPAILLCFFSLMAKGQSTSNSGSSFWVAFPTHIPDVDPVTFNELPANISIFITGSQSSAGKVTVGNFSQPFAFIANQVTEVKVPRNEAYISDTESGTVLTNRGIHVVVDDGQPKVVVYAHIFAGNRSAASLILPEEALSTRYYSMNFKENSIEGQNYITIVATEPNTRVLLKKGSTNLVNGGILLEHPGDTYEFLSPDDLTGVSVQAETASSACKRFAVFSGSSGVIIPLPGCNSTTLDPLFQQLYGEESWGIKYGFIPFSTESALTLFPVRTAGQLVRILAKDNSTVVRMNGTIVATLNSGEYYTTPQPLTQPAYIEADKPVSVAQYALSQSCSNSLLPPPAGAFSDPDMVLLNPVNFNISDITIYSSSREHISEQYVNILIRTEDATSFRINGSIPSKPFVPLTAMPGFSYIQLLLTGQAGNTIHLFAKGGFNAVAYGFGNVESYAYSAGTNLAANGQITGIGEPDHYLIDEACVDEPFYFRLTLPYKSPQINWKMDENEQEIVQNNPAAVTQTINAHTAYIYTLPKTAAYSQPGVHKIRISARYALNATCNTGNQVIDYTFRVKPLPTAAFKAVVQDCPNTYVFSDESTDNGNSIIKYEWDFGDSDSGTENNSLNKNASHTFTGAGTYHVTLMVTSSSGCRASITSNVHIQSFTPSFKVYGPACAGTYITFEEISNSSAFGPAKWQWNFGDGSPIQQGNSKTITHTFNEGGNFEVKLTLINQEGCSSAVFKKTVVINPPVMADFHVDPICIEDAFADFVSTASSGGNQALQYRWDFGDQGSAFSNEKNPRHRYAAAGNYIVTLTVKAPTGCEKIVSKTITVSGAPHAALELEGSNIICGQTVTIRNRSTVSGAGSIIKLDLYFDLVGEPSQKITINDPQPGQEFSHDYSVFIGTAPKAYTIRLIAYAGGGCKAQTEQAITLYPPPQLSFQSVLPLCTNASPIQLTAKEIHYLPGTGLFTGEGVTEGGIFNPALAGKGTHRILCHYVTAGGCTTEATQDIVVLEQPSAIARIYNTIKGKGVRLEPIYSGDNLVYKWQPATSLDRDDIAYPVSTPNQSIQYSVKVSNGLCSAESVIWVNVAKGPVIVNTFTPNGDGKNDLWEIESIENYPAAVTDIFNRYGQTVFHTTNSTIFWDGRYKGQNVPAGTYYFIINLGTADKPISGYITVIR